MKPQILVLLNPLGDAYTTFKKSFQLASKNFRKIKDNLLLLMKQGAQYENILSEAMSQETQKQGNVIQYIYFVQKKENFGIEKFKEILKILQCKELQEKLSLVFESSLDDQIEETKQLIQKEFDFQKWWSIDKISKIPDFLQKYQAIEKLSVMVSQYPMAVLLGPTGQGKTQIFKKFKQSFHSNIQTQCFDYVAVLEKFILIDSPPLIWNELEERQKCQEMFCCFFSCYSKRISNLFFVLKEDRQGNMKRLMKQISPLISEIIGKITIILVSQQFLTANEIQEFQTKCLNQGFKNCISINLSSSENEIADQLEKYILNEEQGINFQGTQFKEQNNLQLDDSLKKLTMAAFQQYKVNKQHLNDNSEPVSKQSDNYNTFQLQEQQLGFENPHTTKIQEQANILSELIEQKQERKKESKSEIVKEQILDYCSRPALDINISRLYQLVDDLATAKLYDSQQKKKEEI